MLLEPLSLHHAIGLYEVLKEPEVHRHLGSQPPPDIAHVSALITRRRAGPVQGDETWLNWAVLLDGVVIGYTQATLTPDEAWLAYVLGKPWWRRGLGLRAAELTLAEIAARGPRPIRADTDIENLPSQRLLERLGFTFTRRAGRDLFYERPRAPVVG